MTTCCDILRGAKLEFQHCVGVRVKALVTPAHVSTNLDVLAQ